MKAIGKVVLGASLSAPLLAGGIHALAKSQGYGAPPTPGFTAPTAGAP